jgi:hypothetical protein
MASWDHGGGFSLDAGVRIEADDRSGLERLLRYCARPVFALERLTPDRPRASGLREPQARPRRQCQPAPDAARTDRPSGGTDPAAASASTSLLRGAGAECAAAGGGDGAGRGQRRGAPAECDDRSGRRHPNRARPSRTRQTKRQTSQPTARPHVTSGRCCWRASTRCCRCVCPKCGGDMRIIAFINEGLVIREILGHLGEPSSAPTSGAGARSAAVGVAGEPNRPSGKSIRWPSRRRTTNSTSASPGRGGEDKAWGLSRDALRLKAEDRQNAAGLQPFRRWFCVSEQGFRV